MHKTNLEAASRATPDTCAQACESAEGAARGAGGGAGRGSRNALRFHTMPSPITYMSSCIACPTAVSAPYSFFASPFISFDSFAYTTPHWANRSHL